MMKYIFFSCLILLAGNITMNGQAAINSSGNPPASDAGLDVDFTDKGFLPPRVALQNSSNASPLSAHVEGMVVYNTATAGDLVPGLYLNNGSAWVALTTTYTAGTGIDITDNVISATGSASSFDCGTATIAVSHDPGDGVSPVSKSVTYGTVSFGGKCWIDRNLGADQVASSVTDNTEPSSGWFWQFNRKQGYKVAGSTRTPASAWVNVIDENSNWSTENDPCALMLGSGWRLPAYSEYNALILDYGIYNYAAWYSSPLKMHAAGRLSAAAGTLINRGLDGRYMTLSQSLNTDAGVLVFGSSTGNAMTSTEKASGFSVRCLHE